MTKFILWENIFTVSEIRILQNAAGERYCYPEEVDELFKKKGFDYSSCCSFNGLDSQNPLILSGPYEEDFNLVKKWCKENLDNEFSTYIGFWFIFKSKEDRFKFELMWC